MVARGVRGLSDGVPVVQRGRSRLVWLAAASVFLALTCTACSAPSGGVASETPEPASGDYDQEGSNQGP
jgi:hypothetical protein